MNPRTNPLGRFLLSLLPLAALNLSLGAQSTWYVDGSAAGPGVGTLADPYTSIQQAIASPNTVDGDTVSVAAGTYAEVITYDDKDLSVISQAGPLATVIVPPGPGGATLVSMESSAALLEGFTVSGLPGLDSSGVSGRNGIVRRCILRDHQIAGSQRGFGARTLLDLYLEECTVFGNEEGIGGGFFFLLIYLNNTIVFGNGFDVSPDTDPNNVVVGFATIGLDPMFWKPDGSDLHLAPGSSLIDAGNPNSPLDPDGSVIDLGALTYDSGYAPEPVSYCTAKLSSDGCLASIDGAGTAGFSVTGTCIISASGVSEFKNGLFYYGLGNSTFPFQGGWFCVTPPTSRTPVQSSGSGGGPCSGAFAIDFNAFLQASNPPFLNPGDLVYGQYWLRDPADPFGSVRTDAIEFGLAP